MIETKKDAATDVPSDDRISRHVSTAWEARRPIRLSIDSVGEVVVEDRGSYEKLLELVDRLECIEALKLSIGDSEADRADLSRKPWQTFEDKSGRPTSSEIQRCHPTAR